MTERGQALNDRPRLVDATDESMGDDQLCELLAEPARALRDGALVAFPTETVYGLGANALRPDAVKRIFEAKERPAGRPLIVHVADIDMARECAAEWNSAADRLASAFWPGPLTLIVPKPADIPDVVTGGLPTVGLRLPSHPVARALIRAAGVPVAAPSANPHTGVSPTTAGHVLRGLGARLEWVVDGGQTDVGIESTVVDVTDDMPAILRPGAIGGADIREVLEGEFRRIDDGQDEELEGAHPSPGLSETHYTPDGDVIIGDLDSLRRFRERLEDDGDESRVGWILVSEEQDEEDDDEDDDHDDDENDTRSAYENDAFRRLPATPGEYGRLLYASLHRFNDANCAYILVEEVPDLEEWRAIRDRLNRAASRRV